MANYTPTIQKLYLANYDTSSRELAVTWSWNPYPKDSTEKYIVHWIYSKGMGDARPTNHEVSVDTLELIDTFDPSDNEATHVTVSIKAVSKVKSTDSNGKNIYYWGNDKGETDFSASKTFWYNDVIPPDKPPAPTVTITGTTLRATLTGLEDLKADSIHFKVFQQNPTNVYDEREYRSITKPITNGNAEMSCEIEAGYTYVVKCRSMRDNLYSDWVSSNGVGSGPSAPAKIITCRAESKTSVYLEWSKVPNATTYDIQYVTEEKLFDSNDAKSVTGIETTNYIITGLDNGKEYFFRVRAVNSNGNSPWTSQIKSIILGSPPSAPFTWSSTTTAVVGETVTLYWTHNSEDESTQRYAEIEIWFDTTKETHTINSVNEEDDKKTMHFDIDTTGYVEGTKIRWRVRTAGVTEEYGPFSEDKEINVYANPTLGLVLTDSSGESIEVLTSLPLFVVGSAGPKTQKVVGYHLSVVTNESYETINHVGNYEFINAGDEIYSKYFDITDYTFAASLSADNIDFKNNISYTATLTVSMDSGLTAEAFCTFTVGFTGVTYVPSAELGFDNETIAMHIRMYCLNDAGEYADCKLSVYRKEFDGSFTEIATGIPNDGDTYVIDNHPSLDYARYRIIAIDKTTGGVSYRDLPSYYIGEKAVIIQWDEEWDDFYSFNEDSMYSTKQHTTSMLKIPGNIDVSDDYKKDVSLIEYIGRKHPVTYYGTQTGETSTWNMDIPKSDKKTLYGVRRLALWPGDVYVREPSGSGYWANVSVSFKQTHCEVVIPITLKITRVEGDR